MYGPLVLKRLADQRHAEALQAARTQRLAKQARANRRPRSGRARVDLTWRSVLSLLCGAGFSK
jgi:hypothetical protein